jgi:triphosphatase
MLTPNAASTLELELKLELPADDLKRLRNSPLLAEAGEAAKTLTSVYYDTHDHRLQRDGIALRLRNDGGGAWLQTVKSDATLAGGLSSAMECEAQLSACDPDLDSIGDRELRRKIKRLLKNKALTPIFETVVERSALELRRGECVAELAVDVGEVAAGGKSKPLREVELELRSGSIHDFLAVARELFAGLNIRPSTANKAERGYRLLKGVAETNAPHYGKPVELSHGQTARDAFAAIMQAAARQIAANQRAVIEAGSPEGAHQMRVGLTRLRAALRSLEPYDAAAWIGELESDAQGLARTVGHLRDADVLIEDIYAPVAESVHHVPGFPELLEALKAHREATYKELRHNFGKGVWPRLLVSLALAPHLLEAKGRLGEPIEAVAREILNKRWKKVAAYGGRLDGLELEERHSMRKAMKKLRYNAEFFASLYGKEAKTFIRRMKEMQELFGALNDARMAHRVIDIALDCCGHDGASLAAAGYVVGQREARASELWTHAKQEWRRLDKAPKFWR